jgi:asparagine synthase (glutamine-hydrolysing)
MGVGLEARAPFLSPEITDFALNCPMKQLVEDQGRGKLILRKAMEKHLPKCILERKKMGFGVPLNNWFRRELREWMISRLKEGDLFSLDWISKDGVYKLIDLHLGNQGNYARPLFNLLVLERWVKRWKLIPSLREYSKG